VFWGFVVVGCLCGFCEWGRVCVGEGLVWCESLGLGVGVR